MTKLASTFALLVAIVGTGTSWPQLSVSDLLEQLKTAQGDELMRVIGALGRSHSERALQPLLDMFDFPHISLPESHYIVVALGELKDGRAIPRLSDAWIYFKTRDFGDESRFPLEVVARYQVLREAIVDTLGQIGGDVAIEILISATRDDQKGVVEHACRALTRLKLKDKARLNCPPSR